MHKNIGWHTRDVFNGTKVAGGSFGGTIDMDTVNRLVNAHFNIAFQASGNPVFVDKQGYRVWLYLLVDPASTEKGAAALKVHREEQRRLSADAEKRQAEQQAEIEALVDSLGYDEAVRRLNVE